MVERLVEAIDVAEARLAVVLLQHIDHQRNALFNGVGGLGAARVGLNPAGCDNELGTTIYAAARQARWESHPDVLGPEICRSEDDCGSSLRCQVTDFKATPRGGIIGR